MKYEYEFEDRWAARMRRECHFGFISGAIAAAALWAGAGAATAATAGTIGAGVLVGAGLGAGEAAITGGDPGQGALGGAISGGVLSGAGPVLGDALGSAFAGDVVAGAAGGTLSAAATGGDLGQGALGGAVSGGISYGMDELTSGLGGTADPNAAGSPGGPGPGPTGTAAPVEAVTVTGQGVPPPITLAGVQQPGAKTASGKTTPDATTPGVENVTVSGVRTPASPLVATASGLVPGSNLQPSTPTAAIGAAQTSGQLGTGKKPGVTSAATPSAAGTSGLPTEAVTVTGQTQPQVQPHAGNISPTGAGLLASSADATGVAGSSATDDPNKKKDESFLDKLGTKTEDMLSNPAVLLAGGVLAADAGGLFHGGNATGTLAGGAGAQADALTNTATDTATEAARLRALGNQDIVKGQDLQDYLRTGTLPPGLQAQLDAARASAKAGARQMYSNMGMGQGNSSLYQDLANIDMVAAGKSADMATELFNSGTALQGVGNSLISSALSNTNAGTDIYTNLMKSNLGADANLSAGVNNFVTALANLSRTATAASAGAA